MKVSVAMITYNHEKFIAQAIESVLIQEVDFDYEIVIGEDCSLDKTGEIVRIYQQRHPDKIRVLAREKNLGMQYNFVDTLQSCTGQYVGLLEGDDYWTSPHKLQKQVDFLDENSDFAICFHNAVSVWENGERPSTLLCPDDQKEVSNLDDIICGNFIPALTAMFRNNLFGEFPDWFYTLKFGDWPLHILNAQYGKIGYINEKMGVYRIHEGGAASAAHGNVIKWSENVEGIIQIYKTINHFFDYKYDSMIRSKISEYYSLLGHQYGSVGNKRKSMELHMRSFMTCPSPRKLPRTIKLVTYLLFHSLLGK